VARANVKIQVSYSHHGGKNPLSTRKEQHRGVSSGCHYRVKTIVGVKGTHEDCDGREITKGKPSYSAKEKGGGHLETAFMKG